MQVEEVDFVSVLTQDIARAKQFYGETLGIHSPNLEAGFPEFETGNVSLYLVDPTAIGGEFQPHNSHIALRVPDVEAVRAELEAKGIEFDFGAEPFDTGVCHMALFKDPDGNQIMLHRRYAPRDS